MVTEASPIIKVVQFFGATTVKHISMTGMIYMTNQPACATARRKTLHQIVKRRHRPYTMEFMRENFRG